MESYLKQKCFMKNLANQVVVSRFYWQIAQLKKNSTILCQVFNDTDETLRNRSDTNAETSSNCCDSENRNLNRMMTNFRRRLAFRVNEIMASRPKIPEHPVLNEYYVTRDNTIARRVNESLRSAYDRLKSAMEHLTSVNEIYYYLTDAYRIREALSAHNLKSTDLIKERDDLIKWFLVEINSDANIRRKRSEKQKNAFNQQPKHMKTTASLQEYLQSCSEAANGTPALKDKFVNLLKIQCSNEPSSVRLAGKCEKRVILTARLTDNAHETTTKETDKRDDDVGKNEENDCPVTNELIDTYEKCRTLMEASERLDEKLEQIKRLQILRLYRALQEETVSEYGYQLVTLETELSRRDFAHLTMPPNH